jgi:hypothetical protein
MVWETFDSVKEDIEAALKQLRKDKRPKPIDFKFNINNEENLEEYKKLWGLIEIGRI